MKTVTDEKNLDVGTYVNTVSVCPGCGERDNVEIPAECGNKEGEKFYFLCAACETLLNDEMIFFGREFSYLREGKTLDGMPLRRDTTLLRELVHVGGAYSPAVQSAAVELIRSLLNGSRG